MSGHGDGIVAEREDVSSVSLLRVSNWIGNDYRLTMCRAVRNIVRLAFCACIDCWCESVWVFACHQVLDYQRRPASPKLTGRRPSTQMCKPLKETVGGKQRKQGPFSSREGRKRSS